MRFKRCRHSLCQIPSYQTSDYECPCQANKKEDTPLSILLNKTNKRAGRSPHQIAPHGGRFPYSSNSQASRSVGVGSFSRTVLSFSSR